MGLTIAQKIIKAHMLSGEMTPGADVGLRIDQTLTQDATGTMAYLEFEAMGVPRVKTERSVAYIDHNTLQTGFENADDHRYIQTVAKKHGIYFSRPGNGICHQVHLERFGIPGKTLIGSDSHTPTGGGIGMLAFGAGGLDVAVAMGGGEYHITMPTMTKIVLTGALSPWVSAKDIILEVLRRMSVKGGVGKIIEYGGPGIRTLTVPERATITNMGTELGATTSIFPSDNITLEFLKAQGREADWQALASDEDAVYDEVIEIDLSALEPLAACPHSPDAVKPVSALSDIKVDQVCIGSCTNSSYLDLMRVASILKGKTVHPTVSLSIAPGSKQVYNMLAKNGALADIIASGARVLECACGPCIGMGQSPNSGGVSLRTFNRNFEGRSGTADGQVYLVSPETAAASALTGMFTDPRTLGAWEKIEMPQSFLINDNMIVEPAPDYLSETVEVLRGPNIKPFRYPVRSRKASRRRRSSRSATTSRPTTSCRPARRSSPTARTSRTSQTSALRSATRRSRTAARRRAAASSSAAPTTDRAPRANTPRSCRFTSASRRSSPSPTRASTARTSRTPASSPCASRMRPTTTASTRWTCSPCRTSAARSRTRRRSSYATRRRASRWRSSR